MVKWQGNACSVHHRLAWKLMTGVAIACLAAGCTKTSKKDTPEKRLAAFNYSKNAQRPALKPNHPLHIATTHWAHKHQKNPGDAKAALNYARNLKALGSKEKAISVLARSYELNSGNGELASEYGRLALDMGKVQMAEQLLNQAQRAKGQTDWRVLSALGTVNAKRGDHKRAQSYYLAALRQKPDATSVFNNLALTYALDGKVGDAEKLLKSAVAKGHNTRRVRQNLALVLGLQSKFGEAQQVARADLPEDKIDNNVNYLRGMVKTNKVAQAALPQRKPAPQVAAVASQPRRAAQKQASGSAKVTRPTSATTPKATRPAKPQIAKPEQAASAGGRAPRAAAPTSILPQADPRWSISVSEASPAAPKRPRAVAAKETDQLEGYGRQ